jgi:hypothetical protein
VRSFGTLGTNTVVAIVAISQHHQEPLLMLDRVELLMCVSLPSWPFSLFY